jgi:hypothetical protein
MTRCWAYAAFRSRLNFIEEPRYQALFDAVDKAAASPDLLPARSFLNVAPAQRP